MIHTLYTPVKEESRGAQWASQRWMPLDRSLAEKLRQHQLRSALPVNTEGWILQTGYRKTVLARKHSGELACSRRGKGGIRPDRLAHVSAQLFLITPAFQN
jgi:hypothetical protein